MEVPMAVHETVGVVRTPERRQITGLQMCWCFVLLLLAALLVVDAAAWAQLPPAQAPSSKTPTDTPVRATGPQDAREASFALPPGLPPRPFASWRRVTNFPDGADTDSTCIGDSKTPLCAIDTYYAWIIRWDPALAWIAPSVPYAGPPPIAGTQRYPWFACDYADNYLGPVKKSKLPREVVWRSEPGTKLAVIQHKCCSAHPERGWSCAYPVDERDIEYLFLKRVDGRWIVAGVYSPRY